MRASTLQPRAHLALARALAWAPPLGAIAAALLSFGTGGVCLPALASLLALHALSVLGLRVGYHRLFTHRRFAAGPGLRVTLAILGGLAGRLHREIERQIEPAGRVVDVRRAVGTPPAIVLRERVVASAEAIPAARVNLERASDDLARDLEPARQHQAALWLRCGARSRPQQRARGPQQHFGAARAALARGRGRRRL